jgi:hypothetical protein
MMPNDLVLPNEAVRVVADHIRAYGRLGHLGVETGAFLLSAPGDDQVSVIAITGQAGIVRRPNLFAVSGKAIDRLFTWAEDRDLSIRAQLHSHRGAAFLSETDLLHGSSSGLVQVASLLRRDAVRADRVSPARSLGVSPT